MRIAIDITRAIIEKAGIGRYTREITRGLLDIEPREDFLLLMTQFNDSLEKTAKIEEFRVSNARFRRLRIPGGIKEAVWGWPVSAYKWFLGGAKVLFAPSFFEVNLGLNLPQVATIHDMATFLFPEQRGEEVSRRHNKRVKKVCEKISKIIAVSQSTKNDIIKLLNMPPERIEVIYPGNTTFPKGGKLLEGLKPKEYILFVGTIEPRKNLKNLLAAYKILPLVQRRKYPLVVVGGKGWNTDSELRELGESPDVKWLGYVSDEDLAELYKNAAIFAYPSLYEGFGLPVIEAEQFGVPVLTSNISSLPEAAGEGGILVNPNNERAISSALQNLLENEDLRRDLGKKALAHAQKFSWEKAAQETLRVLKSAK